MKTRQFLSSDHKRTYTATANTCTCTGYKYRHKCKHTKFMGHPHKKTEKVTPEFVELFMLMI